MLVEESAKRIMQAPRHVPVRVAGAGFDEQGLCSLEVSLVHLNASVADELGEI